MDNPTDIKLETLLLGVSQEYFIDWISRFVKKVNLDALYTLNPKTNFALMYQTELMGPNPISGEIETIRVMYAIYNPKIPFEKRYPIGNKYSRIKRDYKKGIYYQGEEEIFFYPFLEFKICILDDSRIEVTPYVINRWVHDINEQQIFVRVGELMIEEIKKRWPNQIKDVYHPMNVNHLESTPEEYTSKPPPRKRGASKSTLKKIQRLRDYRRKAIRNHEVLLPKTKAVDMIPVSEDSVMEYDRELWDNWDDYEYDK